jgi:hypothetical protein
MTSEELLKLKNVLMNLFFMVLELFSAAEVILTVHTFKKLKVLLINSEFVTVFKSVFHFEPRSTSTHNGQTAIRA